MHQPTNGAAQHTTVQECGRRVYFNSHAGGEISEERDFPYNWNSCNNPKLFRNNNAHICFNHTMVRQRQLNAHRQQHANGYPYKATMPV